MDDSLKKNESKYCTNGDNTGKRKIKKYFKSSQGSYLFDTQGSKFLDFQMQNSSVNFGYQNKIFNDALKNQLDSLPSLASEFMHEERVELSTYIAKDIESKINVTGRVHFSVGGAQAVDTAIQVIANYVGSQMVFTFDAGYHGRTIAASSISSSFRYRKKFREQKRTYQIPYPYCYRCAYDLNRKDCNFYCLERFEKLFETEHYGVYDTNTKTSEYGAFILEPMLGRGGYIPAPEGYFNRLQSILKKYNILLIVDEIQMGMFRTGKLWAFEHYGLVPDMIIFGKAITNGLWPLSGIWANETLLSSEIWGPGSSHATFAGHPIGMRLGKAVFENYNNNDFKNELKKKSLHLKSILNKLKENYPVIGRVDIIGLAASIEIINPETLEPDHKLAKDICESALFKPMHIENEKIGLILSLVGYHDNIFALSPNLEITISELNLFDTLIRHFIDINLNK